MEEVGAEGGNVGSSSNVVGGKYKPKEDSCTRQLIKRG